ncbi:hypothetical protein HWD35_06165 [Tsukamurella tyrosinosolvens]|uniref:hypothetical protein n=1 Tax=Tsukamurella tyrosinosolvens TaxID=57704 RepID=UPI000793BCF1|nr:hypothetical protein [Tsukamurella tyrosinosolvens]AUN41558.1 hypothetical protein ASU32_17360 [Tsukamurella tyrosinosolvens]KXP06945.1 hypothetical protein AXK59_02210 [Tsukamurella tyrosinosolvens]KZL98146.1 hypothetical protein AXX05_04360 [Tsukamurella tyrosinosolvens]MCA4994287.1 hypothetical protein [Tsukamurella tyrosinosolvens]MEC4611829.1 hypothetical protein [Tsukamurella tyrosinosolvens]
MSAQLSVEFAPHWINGWFVRAAYRPWVVIDGGTAAPARWGASTCFTVRPGELRVTTFLTWRVRPAARRVSERSVSLTAAPDTAVVVRVSNGPLNSDPFIPVVVAGPS